MDKLNKPERKRNGNIHPTRIFRHPDELLKVWNEYKEDLKTKSKDWPKIAYVGKDGRRVEDYPVLPLTKEGLFTYCWHNNIGDIADYFSNARGFYDDFTNICTYIKNEIRQQQITGGMLGFYNPSITQRLNNLVEKQEVAIQNYEVKIDLNNDVKVKNSEEENDSENKLDEKEENR